MENSCRDSLDPSQDEPFSLPPPGPHGARGNTWQTFCSSRQPYTNTMRTLTDMYGPPYKLAIQQMTELMDAPHIKNGDVHALRMFALRIRSVVETLEQQGDLSYKELKCCSHTARLLSRLPHDLQISFSRSIHLRNIILPTL